MLGSYIRALFCTSHCTYCGFCSIVFTKKKDGRFSIEERYVSAICHEMELRAEKNGDSSGERTGGLSAIYLGGDTPSQLSFESLQEMSQVVDGIYYAGLERDIANNVCTTAAPIEVMMECSPDDVAEESTRSLHPLPISRISMGTQTFSDGRLRFLHRRHTIDEVEAAVKRLRSVNIEDISVDLTFGFPNETFEEWKEGAERLLALDIEYISTHGLVYEEGTPLYHLPQTGEVEDMNNELYRQIHGTLVNCSAGAGYEQYKINNFTKLKLQNSNFRVQASEFSVQYSGSRAQSPYRSRHSSSCWHSVPYIGIGASTHSYSNGKGSWNIAGTEAYITATEEDRLPYGEKIIGADTYYNDMIMTALRTCKGISLSTLSTEYHACLMHLAKPLQQQGLLREDNDWLHLTCDNVYTSDSAMSDLIKI